MALLSCTECGYCLPCPAGILIPDVFSIYNMAETEGTAAAAERYRMLEVKAGHLFPLRTLRKDLPAAYRHQCHDAGYRGDL